MAMMMMMVLVMMTLTMMRVDDEDFDEDDEDDEDFDDSDNVDIAQVPMRPAIGHSFSLMPQSPLFNSLFCNDCEDDIYHHLYSLDYNDYEDDLDMGEEDED